MLKIALRRQAVGLVLGPLLLIAMLAVGPPDGLGSAAWRTAAVAVLMTVWWVCETLPLPATALLPLVLFPLLGVRDIALSASPFANPVIFLFMGGFMLAQGVQRHGLHRRFALLLISVVGTAPDRVIAGFMAASAFLSMWISNTATAVMMLPLALSVIAMTEVKGQPADDDPAAGNFATGLLIGVAYGASIGGLATLVGTPPNALLAGFMAETYGVEIGFARWMLVGVPVTLVMLPLAWLVLTRLVYPSRGLISIAGQDVIARELRAMGRFTHPERRVAMVFAVVVASWVFAAPVSEFLSTPALSDAAIAIAGALLLFVIPSGDGGALIDWNDAKRVPWGILVLFGGGLSLASAISGTGLAAWTGQLLSGLGGLPVILVLMAIVVLVVFLTELTSNTATAAVFLPIAAALAAGQSQGPLMFLVPVTLAASCAFMMPVATPPNAVIFGSGRLTVMQMVRVGFWMNLLAVAVIMIAVYAVGAAVFDFGPGGRM